MIYSQLSFTDYSPFGMRMFERSSNSSEYRYGFNGKESDDEVKGEGNSYDFGARIYDPRIARWLNTDPKEKSLPSISPYSYAVNSPILYIDYLGEIPKLAIILVPGEGESGHNDFNDHKAALEKQGYEVVYATTGKEALELMSNYSTPESPIESLVMLSHGSPGGLSQGTKEGIYTTMEMETFAKNSWAEQDGLSEYIEFSEGEFEIDEYVSFLDTRWEEIKEEKTDEFWKDKDAISVADISEAIANGSISFKDVKIVFGACNLSGYVPLDEQNVFTTEIAVGLNITVYGSQGYTQAVHGTSKRQGNTPNNGGGWIKTEGNGDRTNLNKEDGQIDLANPE